MTRGDRTRRRRGAIGSLAPYVVFLIALAGGGAAEAGGLSPDAEEVRAAVASDDRARLTALAALPDVDAWAVVDDLVAAGYSDAAVAFCEAYARTDAAALRAFAAAGVPGPEKARAAFDLARGRAREQAWGEALAAIESVPSPVAHPVLAMRLHILRAKALTESRRLEDARVAWQAAAEPARAAGRDLDAEYEMLSGRLFEKCANENCRRLAQLAERLREVGEILARADLPMVLANIGAAYLNLSLTRRALSFLDRAWHMSTLRIAYAPDAPRRNRWARVRAQIDLVRCQALAFQGAYVEALAAAERPRVEYESQGNAAGVAQALEELSNAHAAYGGFEEALRLNRKAQAVFVELGDAFASDLAPLRVNEGHILQELGRLFEAQAVLEAAVAAPEILASKRGRATVLVNLGEIELKRDAWPVAEARFEEALELAREHPEIAAYAEMLRGDALARRGSAVDPARLAAALEAYQRAASHVPLEADRRLHLLLGVGRAEAHFARGDPRSALEHARGSLELLDGMTQGLADGETLAARSGIDRERLFSVAVRAARDLADPPALFEMLERARAQAFLASLGGRSEVLGRLLSPEARGRLDEAAERLTVAYVELKAARRIGRRRRVREAHDAYDRARAAYGSVLQILERDSRRLAGLARPPVADLASTQAALDADEALVLYALLADRSCALVVRRDAVRSVDLDSRREIDAACEALRIDDPDVTAADALGRLRALGDTVLGALSLAPDVRRVLVSPHGVLAHVPWPLLVPERDGAPLDVVLIPSASAWLLARSGAATGGERTLALGDPVYVESADDPSIRIYAKGASLLPLPATRDEVLAITTDEDVRLLQWDATEAGLAAALGREARWRLVHIACHCLLDERRPSFSALALTPAGADDGLLTALEVSLLDASADLVVLSGCETGRDRSVTGEGLSGLTRAFLLAGASRVLASLWPVDDDATRYFMVRFHQAWAQPGVSPPEALRRARQETAARWPHPRDWGAWVLWGRDD